MEYLKNENGIILYEYICSHCHGFFWISKYSSSQKICPFCGGMALINGEFPIKEIEFNEKEEKNSITKIHSKS